MKWLARALARTRELAELGKIRLTHKALLEASELGCDASDVVAVLRGLEAKDFARRVRSELTAEWLYVWNPTLGGAIIYLKVAVRDDCIVVSFHEDEGHDEDQR
jgi:hypothetical protein